MNRVSNFFGWVRIRCVNTKKTDQSSVIGPVLTEGPSMLLVDNQIDVGDWCKR